jgi:NAD(P)-dependent dehydrogenase (short-subunit alcohol dehydrogenase family)
VVDQIHAAGGGADAVAADLVAPDGRTSSPPRFVIDWRPARLMSNARISKVASIEDLTVKDFDALFAVNVRAAHFLVQQVLPMLRKASSVVFVSSFGAASASTPSRREPSTPICRTSPKPKKVARSSPGCRLSNGSARLRMSPRSSRLLPLMRPVGSQVISSRSTAAPSSKRSSDFLQTLNEQTDEHLRRELRAATTVPPTSQWRSACAASVRGSAP